ncbi:MAG: hypothetical protein AAB646_00265 [Patescibacteria group bacterium]
MPKRVIALLIAANLTMALGIGLLFSSWPLAGMIVLGCGAGPIFMAVVFQGARFLIR